MGIRRNRRRKPGATSPSPPAVLIRRCMFCARRWCSRAKRRSSRLRRDAATGLSPRYRVGSGANRTPESTRCWRHTAPGSKGESLSKRSSAMPLSAHAGAPAWPGDGALAGGVGSRRAAGAGRGRARARGGPFGQLRWRASVTVQRRGAALDGRADRAGTRRCRTRPTCSCVSCKRKRAATSMRGNAPRIRGMRLAQRDGARATLTALAVVFTNASARFGHRRGHQIRWRGCCAGLRRGSDED